MISDLTCQRRQTLLLCHSPNVASGTYTLTYTLAMPPKRKYHFYTLGSQPPDFTCPYCPRRFNSRSGRTRHTKTHLQAADGSEPHVPNTGASLPPPYFHDPSPSPSFHDPSPLSSSSFHDPLPSFHDPSPVPSQLMPSPPPSDGFNANPGTDIDIEHPQPNASRITRIFHRKLNGMSFIFSLYRLVLTFLFVGEICDESGNALPPDIPPGPHDSDKQPNDWMPYDNRLQFEVADFLFRRNQMSAGDINFLLSLWTASLAIHSDEPPFSKATHLYETIDSTPLGDVAWESFSLQYNGIRPESNVPSWMQSEYDVWFRDPRTLIHNLLSNPDFKSGFDYTPFQERTDDGLHRFQDFMSGIWAWNQAVSLRAIFFFT
jgi:Plavaka transposase